MRKTVPDDFDSLRVLVDEYECRRISFDEYRARRKVLLDRLDEQYNNVAAAGDEQQNLSIVGKIAGFIKGLG